MEWHAINIAFSEEGISGKTIKIYGGASGIGYGAKGGEESSNRNDLIEPRGVK